jgi:FkbM family methyltransferase
MNNNFNNPLEECASGNATSAVQLDLSLKFDGIVKKVAHLLNYNKYLLSVLCDPHPDGVDMLELHLMNLGVPKQYKHIFYEMGKGDLCIDCGMNKGRFSNLCLARGAKVIAFEPNSLLVKIHKNRYLNGEGDIEIHNAAVGAADGVGFFTRSQNPSDTGGSLVWDNHSHTEKEEVKIIDFAKFVKGKEIFLMKLDIEGSEFDIIPRLIDEGIHLYTKYIVVETHARFFKDGPERLQKLERLIAHADATNIDLQWR